MNVRTCIFGCLVLALVIMLFPGASYAEDCINSMVGVDVVSRYIWRGSDFGNSPSLQPTLAFDYAGLEIGAWGAYTMSSEASEADEIDFWLAYTVPMENSASIQGIVTDYYFPNAGIGFFNFNDYDAVKNDTIPDPGAHTVEVGLSITGPESFPVTFSGFVNMYNDAGNNMYFQLDVPARVGETDLGFFIGATNGSTDNPDYYSAENFSVINIGVTASKSVKVSDAFSLPMNVSFIVNPRTEFSYLVVGLSL